MSGVPQLPYLAGSKQPSPLSMLDEDLIAAIDPKELYRCTTIRALATRSDLCKLLKKTPERYHAVRDQDLLQFQLEHGLETEQTMINMLKYLARLGLATIAETRIKSNMKLVAVRYKWRGCKDDPQYLTEYIEV